MLVLGPDGKAVRVFSRRIDARALVFFEHGAANLGDSRTLVDGTKLSGWAFDGCAKLQGNASRGSTHSRITGSIGSTTITQ